MQGSRNYPGGIDYAYQEATLRSLEQQRQLMRESVMRSNNTTQPAPSVSEPMFIDEFDATTLKRSFSGDDGSSSPKRQHSLQMPYDGMPPPAPVRSSFLLRPRNNWQWFCLIKSPFLLVVVVLLLLLLFGFIIAFTAITAIHALVIIRKIFFFVLIIFY